MDKKAAWENHAAFLFHKQISLTTIKKLGNIE